MEGERTAKAEIWWYQQVRHFSSLKKTTETNDKAQRKNFKSSGTNREKKKRSENVVNIITDLYSEENDIDQSYFTDVSNKSL